MSKEYKTIAVDLDYTILAFPDFFKVLFEAFQKQGHQVGILTARPSAYDDENKKFLSSIGFSPDFYISKSEEYSSMPVGMFKGIVCKTKNIDVIFDDFEHSNPKIVGDFFSVNEITIPFTSWGFLNTIPEVS